MRHGITAFTLFLASSSYGSDLDYRSPASPTAYMPPTGFAGSSTDQPSSSVLPASHEVGCVEDRAISGRPIGHRPTGYCRVNEPGGGYPYNQPSQPYNAPAVPYGAGYAAPGIFAAPTPRGEVAGESSAFGLRGFSIEIPAMHLELPTIKFPSCVRFRRDAEMRVEETYAPFTTGVPAVYGQLVPGGNAFAAPVTPVAPVQQSVALVPGAAQSTPACPTPHGAAAPQSAPQPPSPPSAYSAPRQYSSQMPSADAEAHSHEVDCTPVSPNPNYPSRSVPPPPPPAPPTDPAVSELGRLRQQIALQQQVIAELQKSMELTQRSLSALELAPGEFSESSPSGSIEMRSGQGVIRPVQYRHQFEQGSQRTVNSAESSGRPGRGRVSAP